MKYSSYYLELACSFSLSFEVSVVFISIAQNCKKNKTNRVFMYAKLVSPCDNGQRFLFSQSKETI